MEYVIKFNSTRGVANSVMDVVDNIIGTDDVELLDEEGVLIR